MQEINMVYRAFGLKKIKRRVSTKLLKGSFSLPTLYHPMQAYHVTICIGTPLPTSEQSSVQAPSVDITQDHAVPVDPPVNTQRPTISAGILPLTKLFRQGRGQCIHFSGCCHLRATAQELTRSHCCQSLHITHGSKQPVFVDTNNRVHGLPQHECPAFASPLAYTLVPCRHCI